MKGCDFMNPFALDSIIDTKALNELNKIDEECCNKLMDKLSLIYAMVQTNDGKYDAPNGSVTLSNLMIIGKQIESALKTYNRMIDATIKDHDVSNKVNQFGLDSLTGGLKQSLQANEAIVEQFHEIVESITANVESFNDAQNQDVYNLEQMRKRAMNEEPSDDLFKESDIAAIFGEAYADRSTNYTDGNDYNVTSMYSCKYSGILDIEVYESEAQATHIFELQRRGSFHIDPGAVMPYEISGYITNDANFTMHHFTMFVSKNIIIWMKDYAINRLSEQRELSAQESAIIKRKHRCIRRLFLKDRDIEWFRKYLKPGAKLDDLSIKDRTAVINWNKWMKELSKL